MPRSRVHKSVEQLNHDWAEGKRIPLYVINDFIDSLDKSCAEQKLAELSPALRESVVGHCRMNILTFDSIIAETIAAGDYVDGWIAMRDWSQAQPWAEEARREMEPIVAESRARVAAMDARERSEPNISEQGRMLGVLRVHLMRAQTDEERAEISKQIDELTAEFEKINRS